jgi:hypothetical protein
MRWVRLGASRIIVIEYNNSVWRKKLNKRRRNINRQAQSVGRMTYFESVGPYFLRRSMSHNRRVLV